MTASVPGGRSSFGVLAFSSYGVFASFTFFSFFSDLGVFIQATVKSGVCERDGPICDALLCRARFR